MRGEGACVVDFRSDDTLPLPAAQLSSGHCGGWAFYFSGQRTNQTAAFLSVFKLWHEQQVELLKHCPTTHTLHTHAHIHKQVQAHTNTQKEFGLSLCIDLDNVMGTEKSHLGFISIFSLIRRTATFSLFCQVDRCRKVSKTKYSYRPIYNQVSNIKRAWSSILKQVHKCVKSMRVRKS